jgi:hypothetical protein
MKQLFSHAIATGLVCLLVTGCSVQKRQHLPGYYVEWNRCIKTKNPALHPIDLTESSNEEESMIYSTKNDSVLSAQPLPLRIYTKTVNSHEISKSSVLNRAETSTAETKIRFAEKIKKGIPSAYGKLKAKRHILNTSDIEDEEVRLMLAVIFLLMGIFPASVYVVAGAGKSFVFSIILTSLTLGCIIAAYFIIAAAFTTSTFPVMGVLLILLGIILGFASLIHAVMVLLKNLS